MELGASDVHLKVGQFPVARCDGTLTPLADHPPLTDADLEAALAIVSELTPARRESFYETGELDIAYTSGDLPRFRVNAFRQRGWGQVDGRRAPRARARHRRDRLR